MPPLVKIIRRHFHRVALVSLCCASSAWAHDPYEITSTASLKTNRLDVQIEMEFRTALMLAGVEGALPKEIPPEELFQAKLPQLRELAGQFYEITAGGNRLTARATNVFLGVENHVRFELEYPNRRERPLRFHADSLSAFAGRGPYGTTLTVLDLVNQKVLGQSVLFADNPGVEIPDLPRTNLATAPIHTVIAITDVPQPLPTAGPALPILPESKPPAESGGRGVIVCLVFAVGAVLFWLGWNKIRKSPRT